MCRNVFQYTSFAFYFQKHKDSMKDIMMTPGEKFACVNTVSTVLELRG